jgi:hypothetical protein
MFNIGNFGYEDNPSTPTIDTWTALPRLLLLLEYLVSLPQRLGNRLFAMNDAEAGWRGWQAINAYGGLGRRYRDPRFDTLLECPQCQGTGIKADEVCRACLGGGRLTDDDYAYLDSGELGMAPRHPNDPSVLAFRQVARSGILEVAWHWRYELTLAAGLTASTAIATWLLGSSGLIAAAVTALTFLAGAVVWPPSRARIWCIITSHRVRTGCAQAWVQSRDGRLPVVVRSTATDLGERVLLWCRAGIIAADLEAARDVIAATCWARDVRVSPVDRYRQLVVLDVIRHDTTITIIDRPEPVLAWPGN